MKGLVEVTIKRRFGSAFLNTTESDQIRAMILGTSVVGFVSTTRELQDCNYQDTLSGFTVPTTLIVGENDGVLPSIMGKFATLFRNLQFFSIPSPGHLPNIENPTIFDTSLLSHFELIS